jgi:hypothetical protein
VNNLPDVKTPLEFNFNANMAVENSLHQPRVDIFQFWLVFFETPKVTGPQSSIGLVVHAYLNNLESYFLMSSLYIMLVMNIDVEIKRLAIEHDALLESNQIFFDENGKPRSHN